MLKDRFDEAMMTFCVASVVLLAGFASGVPAQLTGGNGVCPAFGHNPEAMFAGFETTVPPVTDSLTFTKNVSVPLYPNGNVPSL